MAGKRQIFDVWVLEIDTVYRQVPFTVVSDWVQQGRLLDEDQLRATGATEWLRLDAIPELAAFLPKVEAHSADDQAEALQPVQGDFAWRSRPEEGDEDVDMIPLIDVSLVLLIFFMMTATVATAGSLFINTPEARHGTQLTSDPKMLMIAIERSGDGQAIYSLGQGDQAPVNEDRKLSEEGVLHRLDLVLEKERRADVDVKADRELPYEVIKRMTVALEIRRAQGMVRRTFAGVSERDTP